MKRIRPPFLLLALALSAAIPAHGSSMSVSVTPPLMQLTIGPGESWSSSLKIINSNDYDVTYYATVVDFTARGENGEGTFVPILTGSTTPTSYSLASWMTIPSAPVAVKAGQTGFVPFTVHVPTFAEPGGHYAAVLIGTDPGGVQLSGPTMRIASYVSSLIFVKIRGEATEQGRIREFRTSRTVYESPAADFILRFENTGNTHLKPQGDIVIYNMWGKKRGELAVNAENGNFGNVLPQSTRRFAFSWSGDGDFLDIGRYSAVVTLSYGQDGSQNTSTVAYFWVVPTAPVAATLGSIFVVLVLLWWLIRRYIRRALFLEQERLGISSETRAPQPQHHALQTFMEPLREGVIDLRAAAGVAAPEASSVSAAPYQPLSFIGFVRKYKLFFLFLLVVSIAGWSTWLYFHKVMVSSRNFQISGVTISEEQPAPDVRIVQ